MMMSGWDTDRGQVETLDEFDEAHHLEKTYCSTMTEEEYEDQTVAETDKALQDLVMYLESNPEAYARIMRKKKVEEMENGGMYSYLKVKMMSLLHGEHYPACLVAPEEAQNHLNQLKRGMKRAFEYSQESKATRYSSRLAARKPLSDASPRLNTPDKDRSRHSSKRAKRGLTEPHSAVPVAKITPNNPPSVPPPPPPPPPPPLPTNLVIKPRLKKGSSKTRSPKTDSSKTDSSESHSRQIASPLPANSPSGADSSDHEFVTPPTDTRPLRRHRRTVSNSSKSSVSSVSSLSSIHSELMSSNPLRRLRSTQVIRSPGGTPVRAAADKEHLAHSEPLHKALISVMKRKFRNIRTPSPQSAGHSRVSSPNSTSAFSPSLVFTP
ncbi:serine/arginine repetitive matrix protein 1-like [Haliotis cracherodii]|uniref:serine/arginine repetitive matrix protein 1-like n=1 Tax=Haliotis cracherodii TaxID=6455 RepID=UPI0039EC26B5